jgi:cysteine desulfurase
VIYWDHNATTPLQPPVQHFLAEALGEAAIVGNPASIHTVGQKARGRLELARERVAQRLGCAPKEVLFTSSGSEANALALKGAFFGRTDPARNQLIASQIEHPSVLFVLEQLKAHGAQVLLLPPERSGAVAAGRFEEAVSERTLLCSLMWANNETGVIQPTSEVARLCRTRGVLFHSDAVQAAGKVRGLLQKTNADLLSLSGHKLGAPTGVAALVVRPGATVEALVPGHQEGGRRGGTSTVLWAEALAMALELAERSLEEDLARQSHLRDGFEAGLAELFPTARINGTDPRLPNTSNVTFEATDAEALLIALDLEGICVSTGAACASGSVKPSHVLTAMGLSSDEARCSLRFSLGSGSSQAEVDRVLESLAKAVPAARRGVSPLS